LYSNDVYIKRDIEVRAFKSFERPFISALLGPRRVGKSTLVKAYMNRYPKRRWVLFNMDILKDRQRCANGELKAMIQEKALRLIGIEEIIWVVVDEAQKCPELFEQIKVLYDQYKGQTIGIKFILTGSGSLSLHQLSAETLAGRIEILYLREFSLHELANLQHEIEIPKISIMNLALEDPKAIAEAVNKLSPYKAVLDKTLQHYLSWGGLPEMATMNLKEDKIIYLGNYLQTYLEKDVRAIEEITQLNVYQKLIELVAAQTGSIRDDQKLLGSLGCSRETLKKYRGYLIATLMYQEIYPFIDSTIKRLTKSPKGYLVNNGLISYLTGVSDIDILESSGLIGHRFENWFLQGLNAWLDNTMGQHRIDYWRTSGGVEVDFVVDRKPLVIPFEVTVGTQINNKKIKHLKIFMQEKKSATQGFYIYNGPYRYDAETNIHCLPAWCIG
jgi:predicted AAA+ superfamily ATPase